MCSLYDVLVRRQQLYRITQIPITIIVSHWRYYDFASVFIFCLHETRTVSFCRQFFAHGKCCSIPHYQYKPATHQFSHNESDVSVCTLISFYFLFCYPFSFSIQSTNNNYGCISFAVLFTLCTVHSAQMRSGMRCI